jgi:predicted RNA polymerase sigma factor
VAHCPQPPERAALTAQAGIEARLRALAPQVLGIVVRRSGGFDAAEDAVQEALVSAYNHWPVSGVPVNPRAWLVKAAMRRLVDQARSDKARRRREGLAGASPAPGGVGPTRDDTLTLLFLCCHPVLTPASAIALTLRAVGGLTTAEIASAFMVPKATMAQRISRAKQQIKASGVPFQMPAEHELAGRLRLVLHVLYLIFSEGYTTSRGEDLFRPDLSAEAIRLARAVHERVPADGSVTALLALMLLTEARRPARTTPRGELVPLAEQDRALWDRRLVEEGVGLAVEAMGRGPTGEYQVQAAIAALHDEAATDEQTDWPQVLALYGVLEHMTPNPMVTLNRAVAEAMVHGPAAGLAVLGPLESRLVGNHRLYSVRSHLYEMLGDVPAALENYRAAADKTLSLPERHYLTARAARLNSADATREIDRPSKVAPPLASERLGTSWPSPGCPGCRPGCELGPELRSSPFPGAFMVQFRDGVPHGSPPDSCITWRTSTGWRIGAPPGPGTADTRAAISTARASDSTSTN